MLVYRSANSVFGLVPIWMYKSEPLSVLLLFSYRAFWWTPRDDSNPKNKLVQLGKKTGWQSAFNGKTQRNYEFIFRYPKCTVGFFPSPPVYIWICIFSEKETLKRILHIFQSQLLIVVLFHPTNPLAVGFPLCPPDPPLGNRPQATEYSKLAVP